MKLYILRWNPQVSSYKTEAFLEDFKALSRKSSHGVEMNWSIYDSKALEAGDWFIFCRVGTECDGIAGLGQFTSAPYQSESWRGDGRNICYADMVLLMMQNIAPGSVCSAEVLETKFPEINWHGGHAGVPVDPETAEHLAIELVKYIAELPGNNTKDVALRRNDGGRFSLACSLLSDLCPELLAKTQATQTATNAMDETYMPGYRNLLTLDMPRLKSGEDIGKCVRLLDWTGVYSVKDFNINSLLSPKGQRLSVREKFARLLALEEKYDNELPDYWEMPKFKARVALFTENLQATIDFLDHDCDGEMLASMSEFFYEISVHFKSGELIDAIQRCSDRFPVEKEKYSLQKWIDEAEEALPFDVYSRRHPRGLYLHVPDGKFYCNAWRLRKDNASHVTTYVFTHDDLQVLMPLFDEYNDKFDIAIVEFEYDRLFPDDLDEAIAMAEDFAARQSSAEAAAVVARFIEAEEKAKNNDVALVLDL